MYVSEEVISIIFRIINFVVLFGLFRYLFKKYLPIIKRSFLDKLAFFDTLEKQRMDLIEQNKMLVKEMSDQNDLFKLLKEKIKIWDIACKQKKEVEEKEIVKAKDLAKKRNKKQTEQIHQQKLLQAVFPRVIAGTYKQLEEKFEKKEESQKFLKDIIGYMKKSS